MKKEKLLSILAGAFLTAAVATSGYMLHSTCTTSIEQSSFVKQCGIDQEFESFKEDLKASARAQYFDGLINERELLDFVNQTDEMTIHDFIREDSPFTPEEQKIYDGYTADIEKTFNVTSGFMLGEGALGAIALIALVYEQQKRFKKVTNSKLDRAQPLRESTKNRIKNLEEIPYEEELV